MNNPVNAVDPDGREVWLFATKLPSNNKFIRGSPATHTFIVVKTSENKIYYYAYGPHNNKMYGDKLIRVQYKQDIRAYQDYFNGKTNNNIKKVIKIVPTKNINKDEFEKRVISAADLYDNNDGYMKYSLLPLGSFEGNCHSSSSTLLYKAGVSQKELQSIKDKLPGIVTGFGNIKSWTKEEQEKEKSKIPATNVIDQIKLR